MNRRWKGGPCDDAVPQLGQILTQRFEGIAVHGRAPQPLDMPDVPQAPHQRKERPRTLKLLFIYFPLQQLCKLLTIAPCRLSTFWSYPFTEPLASYFGKKTVSTLIPFSVALHDAPNPSTH